MSPFEAEEVGRSFLEVAELCEQGVRREMEFRIRNDLNKEVVNRFTHLNEGVLSQNTSKSAKFEKMNDKSARNSLDMKAIIDSKKLLEDFQRYKNHERCCAQCKDAISNVRVKLLNEKEQIVSVPVEIEGKHFEIKENAAENNK